jgi:hypothetical protein
LMRCGARRLDAALSSEIAATSRKRKTKRTHATALQSPAGTISGIAAMSFRHLLDNTGIRASGGLVLVVAPRSNKFDFAAQRRLR